MHCGKKWWIREFVAPYIFPLNPDYVAARSLRSLRSNKLVEKAWHEKSSVSVFCFCYMMVTHAPSTYQFSFFDRWRFKLGFDVRILFLMSGCCIWRKGFLFDVSNLIYDVSNLFLMPAICIWCKDFVFDVSNMYLMIWCDTAPLNTKKKLNQAFFRRRAIAVLSWLDRSSTAARH